MATVHLKGNSVHTSGELPARGSIAPDCTLTKSDLSDVRIFQFQGKKILNIFPSIDTGTCQASVRKFNKEAAALDGVTVINISADLPFAQARFCGAEGIDRAETASTFRSDFASQYGVAFRDGPLRGLCSRAVLVLDGANRVLHAEQVAETTQEPNYEAALKALR